MDDHSSRSTAELVADVADDLRMLVRKELELARIELTEAVGDKLKGAGLIAAAAAASLPGLFFLVVAGALWLPLSPQAGFAIVGGGLLFVAGIGVFVGIRLFKRKRTGGGAALESVKEDMRWARSRIKR
jgi:hypothetical protein